MRHLSLAIVGADFPNKRGPTRRFGIGLCRPGDPVQLVREPKHHADEFAIAVFGHDVQLGYVRSERAAWLAPIIDSGRPIAAIFQEATAYGCAVRIAFDGENPALPTARATESDAGHGVDDDPGFWPDEVRND